MAMKTILFDLDGTIINSTTAIVESFDWTLQQVVILEYDEDFLISLIGYPLKDMFLRIGVKNNQINLCIENYKIHYRKISKQKTTLLEGAYQALELAKSFAKVCVVTTKLGQRTIPLLEHLDIWQFFDDIVGFDDVKNPKPHKEPIILAMNKVQADKNQTWMIGDTILDMQSAKSANIKSIGVLCGHNDEKSLKLWTDNIQTNTLQAVKIIKNYDTI